MWPFQGENWHARFFDRVRDDVRHVQEVTWPSGGDQYRLDKIMDELNDLQAKLANVPDSRWRGPREHL